MRELIPAIKQAIHRMRFNPLLEPYHMKYKELEKEGPFACVDGAEYQGQVEEGRRHGLGTAIESDNTYYEGLWENDQYHGKGMKVYRSGECYIGQWRFGMRHGTGTYYFKDGSKYIGTWDSDAMDGSGCLSLKTGQKFKIMFNKGQQVLDGHTIQQLDSGGYYQGSFSQGMRHGEGKEVRGDLEFKRNYDKDRMHGYNEVMDADGGYYKGNYDFGSRSGYGELEEANGWKYKGDWHADEKHGIGAYEYGSSGRYMGRFVYNQRRGDGCFAFPSGAMFKGSFSIDPLGPGEFYDIHGHMYVGLALGGYKFKANGVEEEIKMM